MTAIQIDVARRDAIFEPCNRGDQPRIAVGVALGEAAMDRRGLSFLLPDPVWVDP